MAEDKTQSTPGGGAANSATRSAALNGGALAVVALGSAIQVALYLRDFGATHRTDGVIAAIAVYSLVVVLGQLLRTTAVPLLSGKTPTLTSRRFGWAMVVLAVSATVVCAAPASVIASLIAGASGPAGRHIATQAVVIMAPAIGLQLLGSGLAVHGAVRGRLDAVSMAFIASSFAGLVAFFVLRAPSHELVLAWANLASSVALVGALLAGVRVTARPPLGARLVLSAIFELIRSIPLPASFVVMYPVSLALAPRDQPGQITLFGLAFTACSYLAGFTGQALSMADAVQLARLRPDDLDERRRFVVRAFRYSLLLAAPGLGVAAVAGGPIVNALLPAGSRGQGDFGLDILLLAPWLIATLGVWATLPALLSSPHRLIGWRLGAAVLALVLVHVVAAVIGRALWGFDGIVLTMAVAPTVFVAAALRTAVPATAGRLARPAAVVVAASAVSFGLPELLIRSVAQPGAVAGILAGAVGAILYAGLALIAFPEAARTFARLVARR